MKKIASASAGMLLALLVVAGLAPAATAYPDEPISVSTDNQTIYGRGTFTANAASQNVDCDWTLEWNGVTRRIGAPAKAYSTTFTAPDVKKTKVIPLAASCVYAGRVAANQRAAATWNATINITVLPANETVPNTGTVAGDDDLPNTGGPNRWFLLAGVALLITGTGAVLVARRRAENGDALAGLS